MVSFRAAIPSDYRAIAHLHAKSWQDNYRGTFSDHFLDDEVMAERLAVWEERFNDPSENQFVLVAESRDSLVGFVCAFLDKDPKFGTLLDNLHVRHDCIGKRIGRQLMIETARFLEKKERWSMYLWVLTTNKKAINFYRRLGGLALETVNDFDIGDREIVKTRYYWQDIRVLSTLPQTMEE